jgi:hypothetical protein
MGANCCIAAKERTQPCITPIEVSAYRNVRRSPSWNIRWDNRTHIEDIMDIPTLFSNHSSGSIHPHTKSGSVAPTEGFSNGNSLGTSPSNVFHGAKWHKSDKKMEARKVTKSDSRGSAQFDAMAYAFIKQNPLYSITPSIPIIRCFVFSRYIAFAMHINIHYV